MEVVAVRLDVERLVGERLRRECVEEDRCAAVGDDLVASSGPSATAKSSAVSSPSSVPLMRRPARGSRLRFLEDPLDRFCSLLREDEQRNLPLSSAVLQSPSETRTPYSTVLDEGMEPGAGGVRPAPLPPNLQNLRRRGEGQLDRLLEL